MLHINNDFESFIEKEMFKTRNGYMTSLRKQTVYRDTWERLQKETHFTNRQMFKYFPDLYKMMILEEFKNVTITTSKFRRIGKHQRLKIVK